MSQTRGRFIWSKDVIQALIELYQNHPLLYNMRDPNYKNKVKREAALVNIKNELLKLPVCSTQCLDIEDVKNKIHTLRSQFNKEHKKRVTSLRSGAGSEDVYTSSLWWYDNLLFLKEVDDTSKSSCNLENMEIPEVEDGTEREEAEANQSSDSELIFSGTVEELQQSFLRPSTPVGPSLSKKTTSIQKEVARLISSATTAFQESRGRQEAEKDSIYIFSRSVEAEMRKIRNNIRLRRLKQTIMNAIYQAQDEEEKEDSE